VVLDYRLTLKYFNLPVICLQELEIPGTIVVYDELRTGHIPNTDRNIREKNQQDAHFPY